MNKDANDLPSKSNELLSDYITKNAMPELIEKTIYTEQEFFPKPTLSREDLRIALRFILQPLLSTESPEFFRS
ncbi:MAG: hypothetical protein WDM76_03520 [Limisphaerales bacterium]